MRRSPVLPNDVAQGDSVTFAFNVTSPAGRGTYNFQWRMTHDGVGAFGDASANVAVADGVDGATFVSQSVPLSMVPGQSYAVSVTLLNSGNTVWTSAEQFALASQNPQDNTHWGLARLQLPNDVAPGASVTFSFNAVAPAALGVYSFRWRMVRGAVGFGDASADAAVHVGAAPANVYFIEPDHLGTPRLIADENQKTVWKWDNQEPFGNDVPNEDPDGDGVAFDFPMRFPGQYFDRETNLAYNYFRDYSAEVGRYVQSDPIGLIGGQGLYTYTRNSPSKWVDPTGLDIMITINRTSSTGKSIAVTITVTSTLTGQTFSGVTLENISPPNPSLPIPAGAYPADIRTDHTPNRIELIGVPSASVVQIHNANYPSQLEGCVAVGMSTSSADSVNDSINAMNRINDILSVCAEGSAPRLPLLCCRRRHVPAREPPRIPQRLPSSGGR